MSTKVGLTGCGVLFMVRGWMRVSGRSNPHGVCVVPSLSPFVAGPDSTFLPTACAPSAAQGRLWAAFLHAARRLSQVGFRLIYSAARPMYLL
jgi:hypothetical protein